VLLLLCPCRSNRESPASRYKELGFSPEEMEELQGLNLWDEGLVALGKSITALDAILRVSAAAGATDAVHAPPAPPAVPNLPPVHAGQQRAPAFKQAPGTVPLKVYVDPDPMLTWQPQHFEKTGITGRLQRARRRAFLPAQAMRYGFKSLGHDFNPNVKSKTEPGSTVKVSAAAAVASRLNSAGTVVRQPGSTAAKAAQGSPPPSEYQPRPVKLQPYLRVFELEAAAPLTTSDSS
jgi:hypothetical protein